MIKRRSLVLLIAADACWVTAAVRLTLGVDSWRRSLSAGGLDANGLVRLLSMVVVWLTALFVCGAYDRRYLALKGRNLSLTMFGCATAAAAFAGGCYLVPAWHMSRLAFVFLGLLAGLGLVLIRTLWLAIDWHVYCPEFLGVGDSVVLATVWAELARAMGAKKPLSVVSSNSTPDWHLPTGIRYCSKQTALDILQRHGRRVVALTDGTIPSPQAAHILSRASLTGCTVADIFTFYEMQTGRAPIFITPGGWVFRAHHRAPEWAPYLMKRLFDLVVTFALLPIAIPTVALAALVVKITSPGPAFFVQRRIGYGGREFFLLKLRTMQSDCSTQGSETWTRHDDPRVTPAGRILRATGIDELPQLWNVLRGNLSLVGPRPEQPEVAHGLGNFVLPYMQRHVVPSGVTGWAQIHRGGDVRFDDVLDKIRLDLYYVRNFSIWFDVVILLRTFQMLLAGAKPAPSALIAPRAETPPLQQVADSPG